MTNTAPVQVILSDGGLDTDLDRLDEFCIDANPEMWDMFTEAYHKVHGKYPDETWKHHAVLDWCDARTLRSGDGRPYISTVKFH